MRVGRIYPNGWLVMAVLLLAACGSGAVEFAPTQPPPDLSPAYYRHPSGAFTISVPRTWSVYEQNRTNLATAAFAPPGSGQPVLLLAAIRPSPEVTSDTFSDIISQYQTQVRPDVERYKEQNRQAMGDGSWRFTGLRLTAAGATEPVNTFIQYAGPILGVADLLVPDDEAARLSLQQIVNSFQLHPDASLASAPLSTLNSASSAALSILHVSSWTTPTGVFFITGEVANDGPAPVSDVPIRASLRSSDNIVLADASDTVMGYSIPPGGFAPFSLRFGQGQPPLASEFTLTLGGADWQPNTDLTVYGPDEMTWTDESSRDADGRLIITGSVTNISAHPIRDPRVVITVFDTAQNVVAAGFAPASVARLAPGDSAPFSLIVAEMGGQAANYIVTIQGLPWTAPGR